jgi:hypothetical protein
VDKAVGGMALDIMNASNVLGWHWVSTTGLDHPHNIGSHATCDFFMVVRFGALFWDEMYALCGQVYGEKNCQKGVTQLIAREFLNDRRKIGRKRLIVLAPRFGPAIPGAGVCEHREEVAFQQKIGIGRAMIQARRDEPL